MENAMKGLSECVSTCLLNGVAHIWAKHVELNLNGVNNDAEVQQALGREETMNEVQCVRMQ